MTLILFLEIFYRLVCKFPFTDVTLAQIRWSMVLKWRLLQYSCVATCACVFSCNLTCSTCAHVGLPMISGWRHDKAKQFWNCDIYTTKGAASLKSVLKIGPISTRTASIQHQSSRKFVYAYILPVRDLWTARFLLLSFVFYDKNHHTFRHILRYFAM